MKLHKKEKPIENEKEDDHITKNSEIKTDLKLKTPNSNQGSSSIKFHRMKTIGVTSVPKLQLPLNSNSNNNSFNKEDNSTKKFNKKFIRLKTLNVSSKKIKFLDNETNNEHQTQNCNTDFLNDNNKYFKNFFYNEEDYLKRLKNAKKKKHEKELKNKKNKSFVKLSDNLNKSQGKV